MDTATQFAGHDRDWHETRRQGIGGSDARKIMDGEWLYLWEEKTGRAEPEDLSEVLPVQLGTFTEPFNAAWFARHASKVVTTDDCEHLVHPAHPFMRANLDGRIVFEDAFLECKHVNQYSKPDEIVSRYYPQLQHCLAVSGLTKCYLSVIIGTMNYEYFEVARDEEYIDRLITREAEFWGYVENDIPPPMREAETVAVAFDAMREVDLTGNNAWANQAGIWIQNKVAATSFKDAEKAIKELVEADVKLAHGHGIKCSRSKAGSLTIRSL